MSFQIWPIIGATNMAAPYHIYSNTNTCAIFELVFAPLLLVRLALFHQGIGGTLLVAPIYWWTMASSTNRQGNANRQHQ